MSETSEEGRNGAVTIMCGALESQSLHPASTSALPSTCRLDAADFARIDEEEGLHGKTSDGARPCCSVGEALLALGGVAVIVCLCVCVFPMSRLGHGKLSASPTLTASLVEEGRDALARRKTPPEMDRTLREAMRLRSEHQYAQTIQICRSALEGLDPSWSVHQGWEPVWSFYLETLDMTRSRRDLFQACARLAKINPDSVVCAYYRIRYLLGKISDPDSLSDSERRTIYGPALEKAEKNCILYGDAVASADGEPGVRERHFRLLLGEVRLQRWVMNGRPLDEAGQELLSQALEPLTRMNDDEQSVRLQLAAWQECRKAFTFWHSWKIGGSVIVNGEPMNDRQSVERKIDELQKRLKGGANR